MACGPTATIVATLVLFRTKLFLTGHRVQQGHLVSKTTVGNSHGRVLLSTTFLFEQFADTFYEQTVEWSASFRMYLLRRRQ